jgi:hypothetical protein
MKSFLPLIVTGVLFGIVCGSIAQPLDPAQGRADTENELVWYDGERLGVEGRGWDDTESYYDRFPAKAQQTVREAVWNLSRHSAGMVIRFNTDAKQLRVRWTLINASLSLPHMPATGVSGVDVYGKRGDRWLFISNGRPAAVTNETTFYVAGSDELLLYLPLYNGVKSLEIGIPSENTITSIAPLAAKPIVIYGTSITQGACASRPGMACTNIIGRRLNVPIVNLGFSGNGRMEPEVADLLTELDPSIFVLDAIANMTSDMVEERAEIFIRKVRAAHPDTPIVLADRTSVRDVSPTPVGKTMFEVFERLQAEGMEGLHFLPSKGMLGEDTEGTVDGGHPNDLGMMRQAAVFTAFLQPLLAE